MKRVFLNILFMFFSLAFMPHLSSADEKESCALSISAHDIQIIWDMDFQFTTVVFSVSKTKNPPCDFGIGFNRGGSATYDRRMTFSGHELPYQLYKDSSLTKILKDVPDLLSEENVLLGHLPKGKNLTQTFTFYVQIPQGPATNPTLKPSGTYQDSFRINVYEGNQITNFQTPKTSANVNILSNIQKILEISFTPSGMEFNPNLTTQTLNFGILNPASEKIAHLKVRSNAGYSISFSSQQNGALKHILKTTHVPYTLSVDSISQNLTRSRSNPVIVTTGNGQTSIQGTDHSIQFLIGNFDATQVFSGSYTDYITVTATTTE